MAGPIYLDNSATTRICPEALRKYVEVSEECYGNPSSLHDMGHKAEKLIREAERTVVQSVRGKDTRVIFTSSGSEANNLAIIGRAYAKTRYRNGGRIITFLGEHASVSEPCKRLESEGYAVEYLPTKGGEVDIAKLRSKLNGSVILVSCMMVNNETGAVYNLPAIAKAIKELAPEAIFHVDATQGYMKIPFSIDAIGADAVTLSSHKIEGPKGVGALVIRDSLLKTKGLSPIVFGGGQQAGLRSGTENVPGIAAFAEAVRVNMRDLSARIGRMQALRDRLIGRLTSDGELADISPTLPSSHAPHILNITLPGIKSETMLHYLSSQGIYVSSGSACSSNSGHTSSALTAYGRSGDEADTSIRISFGSENTEDDVDALCLGLATGLATLTRIKK